MRCMHACYIISMTTSCFPDNYILFEIASGTPHSSILPTVALMVMKFGTNVYDIVSMTTPYFLNSLRHLLLHFSNLLTAARMEMKLGMHVYYIISMTTTVIFLYY